MNKLTIEYLREMIDPAEATIEDAEKVWEALEERGYMMTVEAIRDIPEAVWHEIIDEALS
ncbi:hypothetical protein [Oceanithermus sp.]|uniref:hypothetical protein n=1 Tax=Oceanithermus sp. TaxID=2268145 RepID=UPI0025F09546|nr:hypothetical protein [Oceanithermus sp.]